MKRSRMLVPILAGAVACASASGSQPPPSTEGDGTAAAPSEDTVGHVRGTVHLGGLGTAAGIQVYSEEAGIGAVTTEEGQFRLDDVPAGPLRLTARLVGFLEDRIEVFVPAGDTITVSLFLEEDPEWRGSVWLGCTAVTRVAGPVRHCIEPLRLDSVAALRVERRGVGVIRSQATWIRFWTDHQRDGSDPLPPPPVIWAREMIVVVSRGASGGCPTRTFVNRVEVTRDSVFVVLGPDSIAPRPELGCPDAPGTPDLRLLSRSSLPVRFLRADRDGIMLPLVDWSGGG